MDDQPAHITVSALTDREKSLLSSGRMFCGHKAQPSRHVLSLAELAAIPRCRNKCGCAKGTIPGMVSSLQIVSSSRAIGSILALRILTRFSI